jgi:putative ubiquitin-RnfH superfamily antitoxin RatB of RatAB toxin-antitoxin module
LDLDPSDLGVFDEAVHSTQAPLSLSDQLRRMKVLLQQPAEIRMKNVFRPKLSAGAGEDAQWTNTHTRN